VAARLVLVGLVASLALVAAALVLALPDAPTAEARRALLLLGVAVALPYAASLALAAAGPERRSRALSLAGGAAGVALVMLGPVVTLLVLFSGFASGPRQLRSIGAATLFVVAQLPLLVAAVAAHRRLPVAQRRPAAWRTSVAAAFVYGLAVLGGARFEQWHAGGGARARQTGHAALHTVRGCAWAWADAHPGAGYPPDLAALGPQGSGCLDARLAQGDADPHRIVYSPAVADAAGRIPAFDLCVHPVRDVRGGAGVWTGGETGEYGTGPAEAADGERACAAAWPTLLGRAKHCILRAATASPYGYPADEAAFLRSVAGCIGSEPGSGLDAALAGRDVAGDRPTLRYRGSPPDSTGVVRGFELVVAGAEGVLLLDETGARHVAEGREPTRADPSPLSVQERDCAKGDAQSCRMAGAIWGNGLGVRPDPARAAPLFVAGCEAGLGMACLEAASVVGGASERDADPSAAERLWKRACELGEQEGCLLLARSMPAGPAAVPR